MKNYTPSEIDRFKRVARRLERAESLRHADALNRVAVEHGFSNWSLLMKHRSSDSTVAGRMPFAYSRSEGELREVLKVVPRQRYESRSDIARGRVEDICARFVSVANAVDFAISYMQALLAMPRYRVAVDTQAQWEMRCWLPYGAHHVGEGEGTQILVNRRYKPVGQADDAFARYERFSDLHLSLSPQQLRVISARDGGSGFLYNDGCLPWRSRDHAKAYVERLQRLRLAIGS